MNMTAINAALDATYAALDKQAGQTHLPTLPLAEYLRLPGVSATAIKAGATSMLHMRQAVIAPKAPSDAMQWGSLVHLAVLEPARLLSGVAVWQGGIRRGKAWDQFYADSAGRIIINATDLDRLDAITQSVRRCAGARDLLNGCEFERVLQWSDEARYGHGKARLDAWAPGRIVDVKTTSRIGSFERQALSLNYHLQMGWYCHGAQIVTGAQHSAYLIAVETVPPYDAAVYQVGYDVLEAGEREAVRIATEYHQCCQRGEWPGVGEGGVRVWNLPPWQQQDIAPEEGEE